MGFVRFNCPMFNKKDANKKQSSVELNNAQNPNSFTEYYYQQLKRFTEKTAPINSSVSINGQS